MSIAVLLLLVLLLFMATQLPAQIHCWQSNVPC
jgi:hypothetical protein